MKTTTIRQTVTIKASRIRVYDTFLDSTRHEEFTGYKAEIEAKVGGKFITCGDRNYGQTLLLKKGERIVQAWSQKHFPEGHYTIIDIKLEQKAVRQTRLMFQQYGVPDSCKDWLKTGWRKTYWEPLKKYLEQGIKPIRSK